MSDQPSNDNEFLNKLTEIVHEHISDEHFGVSELAREIGLSRSSLHRKVKEYLKISVIQFISHQRLKYALDLLQHTSYTVSEVSYRAGFNSPSYFIKCFREYYGYSPSKVENRIVEDDNDANKKDYSNNNKLITVLVSSSLVILIAFVLITIFHPFEAGHKDLEKSIALFPPIYDSPDSSKIYIINGLWGAVIDNLSMINDFEVLPRISMEQFRNKTIDIPAVSKELHVNYIAESNGQIIGDKIRYTIKLIDAKEHTQFWSQPFTESISNMEMMQQEIAKKIANEINVEITPEEEQRINLVRTSNDLARNYYYLGIDFFLQGYDRDIGSEESTNYFLKAVFNFEKAIELDNQFGSAYAELAKTYFYLYIFKGKRDVSGIHYNAIKAYSIDPESAFSLIALGLYYQITQKFVDANYCFESALQKNQSDEHALIMLLNNYLWRTVNLEKSIEYALKIKRLNVPVNVGQESYLYAQLSWAFRYAGFFDEAEQVLNKYFENDSKDVSYVTEKGYLLRDRNGNCRNSMEYLLSMSDDNLQNNPTYIVSMAQNCYYSREFEDAYFWYNRLVNLSKKHNISTYSFPDRNIGYLYSIIGNKEISEKYIEKYENHIRKSQSSFNSLGLAALHSMRGEVDEAIYNLRIFSKVEYPYWAILDLRDDPIYDNIRDHPEFQKILDTMKEKFEKDHLRIRASLKEKGLLPLVLD